MQTPWRSRADKMELKFIPTYAKMPKGKLQLFMIIMNAYSSEKEK